MKRILLACSLIVSFNSNAELRPVDYDKRICHVVKSNWGWARTLKRAAKRYEISPGLMLSIIYTESGFKPRARPEPEKLFGVIPWKWRTDYGYGQINNVTWEWYKSHNPGWFQSRTSFADTLDFIGWYYQIFLKKATTDYMHRDFYIAYNQGLGAYKRGEYKGKAWVLNKANEVALRAELYDEALRSCL